RRPVAQPPQTFRRPLNPWLQIRGSMRGQQESPHDRPRRSQSGSPRTVGLDRPGAQPAEGLGPPQDGPGLAGTPPVPNPGPEPVADPQAPSAARRAGPVLPAPAGGHED